MSKSLHKNLCLIVVSLESPPSTMKMFMKMDTPQCGALTGTPFSDGAINAAIHLINRVSAVEKRARLKRLRKSMSLNRLPSKPKRNKKGWESSNSTRNLCKSNLTNKNFTSHHRPLHLNLRSHREMRVTLLDRAEKGSRNSRESDTHHLSLKSPKLMKGRGSSTH